MIAGIAAVVKALKPRVQVIGVEPTGANAMAQSLVRGERVTLSRVDAFADGVAIKLPGAEPFRLCRELLDGVVLVDNSAISTAIKVRAGPVPPRLPAAHAGPCALPSPLLRWAPAAAPRHPQTPPQTPPPPPPHHHQDVFNETRSILEPAGAVAVAGAKAFLQHHGLSGKRCVAVTSGANMNFDRLRLVSGGEGPAATCAAAPHSLLRVPAPRPASSPTLPPAPPPAQSSWTWARRKRCWRRAFPTATAQSWSCWRWPPRPTARRWT